MTKFRNSLIVEAVGSKSSQICSIGAFVRAERLALNAEGGNATLFEPDINEVYPKFPDKEIDPNIIIYHSPSLYDRRRPWNAITSLLKLKAKYGNAKFVAVVHEFSEAPWHWKLRQKIINLLCDMIVTNSSTDFNSLGGENSKTLLTHLGPTLFRSDLIEFALNSKSDGNLDFIQNEVTKARNRFSKKFQIKMDSKWLVHPGLFTQGKGIDFLKNFAAVLPKNSLLILLGARGPKAKDQEFAEITIRELNSILGQNLKVLEATDDEDFRDALTAADIVVLPYDQGVSERRSSFLASMSCGANIFTTIGYMSLNMQMEASGVVRIAAHELFANPVGSASLIEEFLKKSDAESTKCRALNLVWASNRSWTHRIKMISEFFDRRFSN